jgi:hypothetical protein
VVDLISGSALNWKPAQFKKSRDEFLLAVSQCAEPTDEARMTCMVSSSAHHEGRHEKSNHTQKGFMANADMFCFSADVFGV